MSAVEALAEVLAEAMSFHQYEPWTETRPHRVSQNYQRCCCDGAQRTMVDQLEHVSEAVVAAIRSMPAEQVAELIGGEVQYGVRAELGGATTFPPERWDNPLRTDKIPDARVVTPWSPLGVSPETNGEQK